MNPPAMKDFAKELYDLELIHQVQPLDEGQQERWNALANLVFARGENDERRLSSRLGESAKAKAKLKIGDKEATFDVVNVSWGGLQLKGKGAEKLGDGTDATLVSFFTRDEGAWAPLAVDFRVVRKQGKTSAALVLTDLDPPRRRAFFQKAYYPLYLEHIKAIAEL
ncbi:MAG: hypothetical protein IT381_10000 [Deltaproteobacteria bacterium]|nr:hypothetical protein [Deltaproteobacteria bacterium]